MHIPYFFLNNNIISKPGEIGLDPFCGSGTVLLESILVGRNCYGADSNPLAQLISQVKTTKFDLKKLSYYRSFLKRSSSLTADSPIPAVININHWFSKTAQQQLAYLLREIQQIEDETYQRFFLLCFSVCVRKVSNADPRVSVPVRLKAGKYKNNPSLNNKSNVLLNELTDVNVIKRFFEIVDVNIKRLSNFLNLHQTRAAAQVISNDARQIQRTLNSTDLLASNSVDYVITSPPYAGAQKYIRASSLNLCWTQLSTPEQLKQLDNNNIGRENYRKSQYSQLQPTGLEKADQQLAEIYKVYPLRAHIAGNYLREMTQAFAEIARVLKQGKFFVLVAANNQVCGHVFPTHQYLREIAQHLGFCVELELIDDIHSYGLMTKRNKTASVITREWITVFRKK